jgi:aminoglycoside 3-N-acetyltransferase
VLRHDAVALTRTALADDLTRLGVRRGQILLVHASLRKVGSGAETVIGAIRDVLRARGTIVVLTATAENSTSSRAHLTRIRDMSVPEVERYRQAMPAFDPARTPSTGMGALAEYVRTSRGARRSRHPQTSFAALGRLAAKITRRHAIDCHLGERSPLGRLYRRKEAHILMLGVGYDACTALHLAEYRYTPEPPTRRYRCVIERDGRRIWWEYEDVVLDDGEFDVLGKELDGAEFVAKGQVGGAASRLIPLRGAVDFAERWLRDRRGP